MNAVMNRLTVIVVLLVPLVLGSTTVKAQSYTEAYTYDAQGRLTIAEYSTSKGVAFEYDVAGNITAVQPVDVLPVELTSFEAVVDGGHVLLAWQTASETDHAGFEVQEREKEGEVHWEKLAFVEGAGTTSEPQSYEYRVKRLTGGVHLFRLKGVDLEGDFEFSAVVEVNLGAPERFALHGAYPNPTRGTATIPFDVPRPAEVRVTVYDVLGRRIAVLVDEERAPGWHAVRFNTTRLATGLYFYRIHTEDFQDVKKLVVVR